MTKITKIEAMVWTILVLTAVAVILSQTGCAQRKRVVYGADGPGFQHEIYHPKKDPLFKNESRWRWRCSKGVFKRCLYIESELEGKV